MAWFKGLALVLFAGMLLATSDGRARADVTDPAGDFLTTFIGTPGGDLDVLSAGVLLAGDRFRFSATLDGTIGTTPGGVYVYGLDRGAGTERFVTGTPSVGEGIFFDSLVVINANGTGSFIDLVAGPPPVSTPLDPADIHIQGNTLFASLPVSLFPSRGFALDEYTWNLWPRDGGGNARISDFAPDASNAAVSTVPEPAALVLAAVGSLGATVLARRRRGPAAEG